MEYGEELQYAKSRGAFKTVGDKEHVEIINSYITGKLSMGALITKLGRSKATIHRQVKSHDQAVKRSGFCPRCK